METEKELSSFENNGNVNKKNRIVFISIVALLIELLPIIVFLLSLCFNKIYNSTEKYEYIAVMLEDLSITMLVYNLPILGLVLSIIGYNVNRKSLFSKTVMIINIIIVVVMVIYIAYLILTPWNLGE